MYKEHPGFENPETETIWRYMDFPKFISLLDKECLYFTGAGKFKDPFEGAHLQSNLAGIMDLDRKLKVPPALAEELRIGKQDFRALMRKFTLINCWHINESESDAMWKLYIHSNQGIAIQTTFAKLCESFNGCREDIFIGRVKYGLTEKHLTVDNFLSPFLYKRKCFEHEKELRAITWALPKALEREPNDAYEIDDSGVYLPVDVKRLVDKVYISPTSPRWFTDVVLSVMDKYGFGDREVIQSDIYTTLN